MKIHNNINSLLARRNVAIEREFLLGICDLGYFLLQRDWESASHGDLDLVIPSAHWSRLITAITDFSMKNKIPIVKAYEIEYGVVCIILLLDDACIHLDVAITPYRANMFGVDLVGALRDREVVEGVYIVDEVSEKAYKAAKKFYKQSVMAKIKQKFLNGPVLLDRFYKTSLYARGVIIHVPYILDESLLRSKIVIDATKEYLLNDLLPKYRSCK
jgi:hypothetical protein